MVLHTARHGVASRAPSITYYKEAFINKCISVGVCINMCLCYNTSVFQCYADLF